MKQKIVIFETEGGNDKWLDGYRKDTLPIANALRERGWDVDILKYRDEWADKIYDYAKNRYDAYIPRVYPGSIPKGETIFFKTLHRLSDAGLIGFSHPDVIQNLSSKEALVKLIETNLVPEDTYAYYTVEEFKESFPKSISYGKRVLKRNNSMSNEGVWRIKVIDERPYKPGDILPLDTKLKLIEVKDNHVEYKTLDEFMNFVSQYIEVENDMLIDMRFLPRIKEGKIRVLMVGEEPIFVIHQKMIEKTNFSSEKQLPVDKYTFDHPKNWKEFVKKFTSHLPDIMEKLGGYDAPLIWSADFVLDWDENGNDSYVLNEINNFCVDFSNHLNHGIQDKIAERIIKLITKKNK